VGKGSLLGLALFLALAVGLVAWSPWSAPPTAAPAEPAPRVDPAPLAPRSAAELARPQERRVAEAPTEPAASPGPVLAVRVLAPGGGEWNGPFELVIAREVPPGQPRRTPERVVEGQAGALRLTDLARGLYLVYARAPGRRSAARHCDLLARAELAVEFELTYAGSVQGRLVDARARPLSGVAVRVGNPPGQPFVEVRCDEQGRFVCSELVPGSFALFAGPVNDPILRQDAIEHRGTQTDLGTLVIEGLGDLQVTVLDGNGLPVEGARVWDGDTLGHVDQRTDVHGRALARFVPARQVRVFAQHAELGLVNAPVLVVADGETALELKFKPR